MAQVNGRSFITWEEIFAYDIEYVNHLSLVMDVKIFLKTIQKVLKHEDIADVSLIEKGNDGQCYVQSGSQKVRLHQPLDIERGGKNIERDRQ